MKKFLLAAFALITIMGFTGSAHADRVGIYVGAGYGGGYYHRPWGEPYYPAYGYPGYYPYYYYAAPPPPVVYGPPPVAYATPAVPSVDQSSPTFTDSSGRTCREYQSTAQIAGGAQSTYGTACLQPDGSWRVVQ